MKLNYIDEKNKDKIDEAFINYLINPIKITNLAKYFNINLDKNRLEDYFVNIYTYNEREMPTIEIIDTKNNIIYNAQYTGNASDMLNISCDNNRYIKQIVRANNYLSLSYYLVKNNKPIIQKANFITKNYELSFEKEYANEERVIEPCPYENLTIRYQRNNKRLLTKYYGIRFDKDNITRDGFITYNKDGSRQNDKCFFESKNNLIYRINEINNNDMCLNMQGVCFENNQMDIEINNYFPDNFYIDNHYMKMNSSLIFQGLDTLGYSHFLEINKTNSGVINIFYIIKEKKTNSKILSKNANIKARTLRKITTSELDNIINYLIDNYETFGKNKNIENNFLFMVLLEIEEFKEKINIKNNKLETKNNYLTPKELIDKDITEVIAIINSNLENYLALIDKEYNRINATNKINKNQTKKLKK